MDNMTAKVSCFARAYHMQNSAAHVFADAAARALLGEDYEQIARSMAQGVGFFMPGFRGSAEDGLRRIVEGQLAPSVLARSAWCEATLANERRFGCGQYVVFAAGYDTFAIRNRDAALSVFELDLPEMLSDKRARVARAGLASRAIDVPCDLSRPSWRDQLLASGFRPDARAFASLLGISYYLEKPALANLLTALGGLLCAGSALCLDYPTLEDGREAEANRALARGAGEPMRARYGAEELEALLETCRFLTYEHLDHAAMTERFFADYNRRCPEHRMQAPAGVGYVLAVRKP